MLMVGSVSFATDKSFATVTILASKTDPFWQGATLTALAVQLSTCAVSALNVVYRSQLSSTPLFILNGDRPFDRSSFPQTVLTTPPSVGLGAGRATASIATSTNLPPTERPSPRQHSTPTPLLLCHLGFYKMKCKPFHRKTHPPCHHKNWLDQTLVAKWDGLVSQGKTHIVANVMVYSSLKVFGHPQYSKIPLKYYLAGVAPKILRAHCRNKFDKFEPLKNPFCGNKADQGKTSGAGYKEVAQHGEGTTTGQPATTTAPNTPSSSK
ncbi:hypothetical protein NDA13_000740 [Ustilago tritici]|nr:hypothetical protein NDA13_000740 [Ustilago tritici]